MLSELCLKDFSDSALVSLSEPELVQSLKKLQSGFTDKREQISDYRNSPRLISAYYQFYTPSNFRELWFLLDQSHYKIPDFSTYEGRLVDYGSGPGTMSLAFLFRYPCFRGEVRLIDISPLMLEQAKKAFAYFFPEINLTIGELNERPRKDEIWLMGNVFNELDHQLRLSFFDLGTPEWLFLIEPGTSNLFPGLLELREKLKMNHSVYFPCPHLEKCPMNPEEDWCHQILRQPLPHDFSRLSQIAKIDRSIQPMSGWVYGPQTESSPVSGRMVRYLKETKFSHDWMICNKEAQLETKVFKKKDLDSKQKKEFKKSSVGVLAGTNN